MIKEAFEKDSEKCNDKYDFNAQIKLITYVYSIIGTFIVSFVVNKVLSNKVKTIDMITSLKGNE